MPAFSHFFLKRLSARSKFSSSWMITSDMLLDSPLSRPARTPLAERANLDGDRGWWKWELSRRPRHPAPAQHVKMQVIHTLSAVSAGVADDPVSPGVEAEVGGYLRRESQEAAKQRDPRFALGVPHRAQVLYWDDQHVGRRHRLHI